MSTPLRVLIVEDSEDDAVLMLRELRHGGYGPSFKRVETARAMTAALANKTWDVVIADYNMPHFSAPEALKLVQESGLDLPFIIVSGVIGEDVAVEAMKAGAHDYILKGSLARLVPAIERELREATRRREHRHLEEQLLQSQKMETIGRLAGGMAHDFNTLLTVIMGYTEIALRETPADSRPGSNLVEIQKAAERAARLTQQLRIFSRRQGTDARVIDLNEVITSMHRMLRRLIGENIELVTLPEPDLYPVKADPAQIEQVLMNLVVNASDAMPKGGRLTIETAKVTLDEAYARVQVDVSPGQYVLLTVSDTGVGMTREVKARVFEPFFTTKEAGIGTGLGLATCYGIVKESGGYIEVHSELGHGTTFKVYLPRTEAVVRAEEEPEEAGELPRGVETVLLAEDEPAVRSLAVHVLRDFGYTVLEASNGDEALRVAEQHANGKIHLLLTDVVMPQMGGIELAERLKSIHPDIRVLLTSGYTDDAVIHYSVLSPDTPFMQKPFLPADLARQIRQVLDS